MNFNPYPVSEIRAAMFNTRQHWCRHYSRDLLILDPLRPERIAKSQAASVFPKPHFISLDLWGTVFTPKASIAEQYYRISSSYGLQKLLESIRADFPKIFNALQNEAPNYGKHSGSIKSTREWWETLIKRLYKLGNGPLADRLCAHLVEHFSTSEAYELFPDVTPTLKTLQENSIPIIGATNSDDRVKLVLSSLGVADYFDNVYMSYDLGCAKPDRAFFRAIANSVLLHIRNGGQKSKSPSFLENVWHVGDHYNKDFVGAVKSGWNGVLLDREKTSVFMRAGGPQTPVISNDCFAGPLTLSTELEDLVVIANNRACVSSLRQVPQIFGIGNERS